MSADALFQVFNIFALAGWLVLGVSVLLNRADWRDRVAGLIFPLILSFAYLVLIVIFFGGVEGGFDSLPNVQKLFTSPWVALAGWVHYLAFDLFIGSWIARRAAEAGLSRWPLVVILPLTFLFGPIGLLAFHAVIFTRSRMAAA